MVAPRCWIGVAAASHVRVGRAQGFVMFAHGKHSAVKQLRPGDAFAYYSPTETLGGKDGCADLPPSAPLPTAIPNPMR